jgi:maltooligosyltrehalose trehalohydrolase
VPHLAGAQAIGAEATGEAAVTARWRLGDGSILTIALDLAYDPAPLPEGEGELLHAEGERFRAWIAK